MITLLLTSPSPAPGADVHASFDVKGLLVILGAVLAARMIWMVLNHKGGKK